MGCKQSKHALEDEHGHHHHNEYMDGRDYYKGNPADMDGMYPGGGGIQTEIIPTHQYGAGGGGGSGAGGGGSYSYDHISNKAVAPLPQPAENQNICDAQFTQMAEGCTVGFLEMVGLSSSQKMITNGPDHVNAYQRPAYAYQTPHSLSDLSHAHSHRSNRSNNNNSIAHNSQNSQRRAVLVPNGSFTL